MVPVLAAPTVLLAQPRTSALLNSAVSVEGLRLIFHDFEGRQRLIARLCRRVGGLFLDGKILNSVISEFLEEVIDGVLPFPGMEEMAAKIQSGLTDTTSKKETVIPTNDTKIEEKAPELTNNSTESPLSALINKLSKKNFEPIDTKLNINIPKKNVFKMLLENGDETKEELIDIIVQTAIKQIDINKLQEFLITETSYFIRKYYER